MIQCPNISLGPLWLYSPKALTNAQTKYMIYFRNSYIRIYDQISHCDTAYRITSEKNAVVSIDAMSIGINFIYWASIDINALNLIVVVKLDTN